MIVYDQLMRAAREEQFGDGNRSVETQSGL